MGILGKFGFLSGIKAWSIALVAVMGFAIKLLYARGERLEEKLERANEKVEAARSFRANRKKVRDMDIGDIDADIKRVFPPSRNSSDSPD